MFSDECHRLGCPARAQPGDGGRVAHGDVAVAEVLLSRPWEAESMEVCDLLLSQRRWGMMRARKVLAAIPIPENKHIGSLTDRQRNALARKLGATAVATA